MLKHLVTSAQASASEDLSESNAKKAKRMVSQCFPEQRAFILDKSSWKSLRCPRRAGKSYSSLVLLCTKCLTSPGAITKYICLTRGQAKANLWRVLKQFSNTYELELSYHETDTRATFPNGSVIEFAGAETRQEIEKFRGQSFDLCVIDEGKSFQIDILDELIYEILDPALADRFGTLAMIGTPGNILAGPFYEATSDYDPEDQVEKRYNRPRAWNKRAEFKANGWKWNWSFHSWHTEQNTAMPHIWQKALENKENRGIPDNDPSWVREWLGEWCPSESLMVYHYSAELNLYSGVLPEGHEWNYLLGLDLGYNDSTAIVVAAYSDTCPDMYQVYEWKAVNQIVDQIERKVKEVKKLFPDIGAMVADTGGLGKTIIETLQHHGLGFEAALKTNKLDHIEMVNSDLRLGRIKLLPDSSLSAEMKLLQWKDKNYRAENKATDNHLCDAFLYLIRFAYHSFWQPATVEPTEGTPEWAENFDELEHQAILAQHSRNKQAETLDQIFDNFSLDGKWIN